MPRSMSTASLGFRIYKTWQILKHFARTFCQAHTLKLGGVRAFIRERKVYIARNEKRKKQLWFFVYYIKYGKF